MTNTHNKKLSHAAALLFFYTLLVILWGAWVRISHSGDGCGDTWPLCQGQLIPEAEQGKTWVEYTHRLMSGLFGFYVFGLLIACRKIKEQTPLAYHWAKTSLVLTVIEALLGAKLVLFGLVGSDDSLFRAMAMSLHQVNSLMLAGSILLLYRSLSQTQFNWSFTDFFKSKWSLLILLFFAKATTGAWAALSTTLFPSNSLMEGLLLDFSPDSHPLIKLRLFHPIIASLFGFIIVGLGYLTINKQSSRLWGYWLSASFAFGILFGYFTLFSLSPVWLKLSHLAMAYIMWTVLLLFITQPKMKSS